jgi:putative oxidoreductase
VEIGLLLVRVVVGALFVGHGAAKLFGWFAGGGVAETAAYFRSLRYPNARALAVVAGATEALAGLGLVLGWFTPLAAAALIGVLLNAAIAGHGHAGLWSENDGYEYPLVLMVLSFALAWAGPGAYALDTWFGWDLTGAAWAIGAAVLGVVPALVVLGTRHPSATHDVEGSDHVEVTP